MLSQAQRTAILELSAKGVSKHEIAQVLRLSRLTVRKVLRSNSTNVPEIQRAEKAEPYREQILDLLTSCKGNLVRVHEELVAGGAALSYPALTGFCRRQGIGQTPVVPAGQYHFEPGVEMQHDTSPHTVEVGGRKYKAQTASVDYELIRLLGESHKSFENLKHLQTQLVQKEKLASLGQLVAGAAHEINNPLTAILGYSELLAENHNLDSAQVSMAKKIGQQARRTRDLVSGLLSFAQQAPAEKTLVDLRQVAQRAVQMKVLQLETKGIRVENRIATTLPPIWGNFNQLMRCCLEIIGNAMDALEQTKGGTLWVSVQRAHEEIVLEFADSGPGMQEPKRVFDPFYTTKEIGKGTGLGLSATYGVVQDHQGQITCHNRPEGGAAFVLRFPIAESETPSRAKVLANTSAR